MEQLRVGVFGIGRYETVRCRAIAGHPELEVTALESATSGRVATLG